MTYVLNLKPETAQRIEEKAKANGATPEQWLENLAEETAEQSPRTMAFEEASEYVLNKNAELYRRLA